MSKSYKGLILIPTFEGRFEYLKIGGTVGHETFGYDRYLNQLLYTSGEWKAFRNQIIIRDEGCDLGIPGRDIFKYALIHHINPITVKDVLNRARCVFDPDNVITTILNTHNAIHYGDASLLISLPKPRQKGDTCPWKVY